jgi:hypothetical protein
MLVPERGAPSRVDRGGELRALAGSSLELDEFDVVVGEDAVSAP